MIYAELTQKAQLPDQAHTDEYYMFPEMTSKIDFERSPETGLSILVIGAGIGGLCFAIEAYRKGHDVRLVDRRPDLSELGKLYLAILDSYALP